MPGIILFLNFVISALAGLGQSMVLRGRCGTSISGNLLSHPLELSLTLASLAAGLTAWRLQFTANWNSFASQPGSSHLFVLHSLGPRSFEIGLWVQPRTTWLD
jgi:hypothetical protein